MARDPRKLRVFGLADRLVLSIYDITKAFPDDEKFGLVSQMRRASVSIPTNIAEGCGRRTTSDYLRFLTIATGSAYELAYLCGLSGRLEFMKATTASTLEDRCQHVAASLTALVETLENAGRAEAHGTTERGPSRRAKSGASFEIAVEDLPKKPRSRRR